MRADYYLNTWDMNGSIKVGLFRPMLKNTILLTLRMLILGLKQGVVA